MDDLNIKALALELAFKFAADPDVALARARKIAAFLTDEGSKELPAPESAAITPRDIVAREYPRDTPARIIQYMILKEAAVTVTPRQIRSMAVHMRLRRSPLRQAAYSGQSAALERWRIAKAARASTP